MKRMLCMAAALLLAGPLAAESFSDEDLAVARELRESALAGDGGYEIVADLTTRIGPRPAGSEADARAVEWAVNMLEDLGFDRVWTEPASFRAWHRGHERTEVVSPAPHELVSLALGFSPATPQGGIEADVVMFDDLAALEAADPTEVTDRIVFIRNRMERTRTGAGYGRAVGARSMGSSVAAEKGGKALVIRSIGTSDNRFAHTGMQRSDPDVAMVPAVAISNPDADLLERLMAGEQPVRIQVEVDAETVDSYTSQNVFAEITGAEKPEEIVAIGAHLDSWDVGTGAIDDGAGVAIVTEAARLIMEADAHPDRSIRVILFAAEEIGLWGGKAWAKAREDEIGNYQLVAESDFGAGEIYAVSARVQQAAWPMIEAIQAELAPLGIELGRRRASGGPDFSPASRLGVAAVDLHQDGSKYFDYHHTANDTLDKIEPEALAQNAAAYAVLAWLGAQAPMTFGSGETILGEEAEEEAQQGRD